MRWVSYLAKFDAVGGLFIRRGKQIPNMIPHGLVGWADQCQNTKWGVDLATNEFDNNNRDL